MFPLTIQTSVWEIPKIRKHLLKQHPDLSLGTQAQERYIMMEKCVKSLVASLRESVLSNRCVARERYDIADW